VPDANRSARRLESSPAARCPIITFTICLGRSATHIHSAFIQAVFIVLVCHAIPLPSIQLWDILQHQGDMARRIASALTQHSFSGAESDARDSNARMCHGMPNLDCNEIHYTEMARFVPKMIDYVPNLYRLQESCLVE
jgi:hypothetical protein